MQRRQPPQQVGMCFGVSGLSDHSRLPNFSSKKIKKGGSAKSRNKGEKLTSKEGKCFKNFSKSDEFKSSE